MFRLEPDAYMWTKESEPVVCTEECIPEKRKSTHGYMHTCLQFEKQSLKTKQVAIARIF